jgi:hypothetical protein
VKLTEARILEWADAHYARTGKWPGAEAGAVVGASGENWQAINQALVRGNRGLPGGSSLAQLLAERRGKRHMGRLPRLTVKQILRWADQYHGRTGRWPDQSSGTVEDAPGEVWVNINAALKCGFRGLPGGDSLSRLLDRHRPGRRVGPPRPSSHPWTPEEDELVRTLPPGQAAERAGRSLLAVYARRRVLGVPDGRRT